MSSNNSTLYVVGTPIGNLGDISERALETLGGVDYIFSEDTRVTNKLVSKFDLDVKVLRYNEHEPESDLKKAKKFLEEGKDLGLVTDSGTPAVSDPGGKMVNFVRRNVDQADIRVVPGPSALTAALSVAGLPANEFTFLGYPPSKNKREKFFKKVDSLGVRPVVLYESTHRTQKTFDDLIEVMGDVEIFVAKEMTKVYEDYFVGFISEAKEYFSGKKGKGEFVIIIP